MRSALERIPGERKWPSIFAGLLLSLFAGCAGLLLIMRGNVSVASLSVSTVASGILLFPVGTGLYYLCGHAFGGRVEFASQFSNVKPIFSVAFAAFLLGEALPLGSVVSLVLILLGVAVLLLAIKRGTFSLASGVLGLLLAAAWGGGEAFAKLGMASGPSLEVTFWALVSGCTVAMIAAAPVLVALRRTAFTRIWAWAPMFLLHGLLSFTLAYALLFESISRIGVAKTALINAFWPGLAIVVAQARKREPVPRTIVLATVLLIAGSLVQLATTLL